jgi:tRNA dimethylallyltransferase
LVRTSRALEVYEQTGIPITELRRRAATPLLPWRLFVVILDYPLDKLRPLIHSRVERMMAAGFLAEVEALRKAGFGQTRALASLGYKQLGQHLEGVADFAGRRGADQEHHRGLCPTATHLVQARASRPPSS